MCSILLALATTAFAADPPAPAPAAPAPVVAPAVPTAAIPADAVWPPPPEVIWGTAPATPAAPPVTVAENEKPAKGRQARR